MADYTGKAQFFMAFKCPRAHEAEGDRFFAHHAAWMERTHPREGDKALLQYTVAKHTDDDGDVLYLISEVYETMAGAENHSKLANDDKEDSRVDDLWVFSEKCETIFGNRAEVLHSLW